MVDEGKSQLSIEQKAVQDVPANEATEEVIWAEISRKRQEQLLQEPQAVEVVSKEVQAVSIETPDLQIKTSDPTKNIAILPSEATSQPDIVDDVIEELPFASAQESNVVISVGKPRLDLEPESVNQPSESAVTPTETAHDQSQPVDFTEPVAAEDAHTGEVSAQDLLQLAQAEIFGGAQEQIHEAMEIAGPAARVTESIAEHQELTESEQEQTEALVAVLPELVQESLVEHIRSAEPEKVEKLEELVVSIAEAANELTVLTESESPTLEEVGKVEAVILEKYEELLAELGIELEEEQKQDILIHIKSGDFSFAMQQVQNQKIEKTPEMKHGASLIAGIKTVAHEVIGKFAVRQSAQLA